MSSGSFDPELNLVYWGVGNPGPDWNAAQRPGDNLYSDSAIALDADTGELVWYFQFTPNDGYDYDAVQVPVLADSGVESGTDIVRFVSQGADMVFAGRCFMYGVAAFGQPGAQHAIDILAAELEQTLSQLGCASPSEAAQRLA